MESALSELKKETGLSEDEIKDLTNETDVSQVLDQYKSNADKAMVLFYVPYGYKWAEFREISKF